MGEIWLVSRPKPVTDWSFKGDVMRDSTSISLFHTASFDSMKKLMRAEIMDNHSTSVTRD